MTFAKTATFRGSEPTWANACVGENGSPDLREYAEGYAAAANVLIEEVLKSRGLRHTVDLFIYPICFNMRHAVELFLKKAVEELRELAIIRGQRFPEFDSTTSHDLGRIWAFVSENSIAADSRYGVLIGELGPFVSDIAAVDSNGQVFRYPFSIENRKHLTEISVISIAVLYKQFKKLQELLKQLAYLNTDLLEEFRWGTFTRTLSRRNLIEIASELPPRAKWSEAEFDVVRNRLRTKYRISAREYSEALRLVQTRHEMAGLIGSTLEIENFSPHHTAAFLKGWLRVYGIEELRASFLPPINGDQEEDEAALEAEWRGQPSIEVVIEHTLKVNKEVDQLVQEIPPRSFAPIQALFYFEREPFVSEAFERQLRFAQRDAAVNNQDKDKYWESVQHVFEKTSLVPAVLNSLNFLAQTNHLEYIIESCGLQELRQELVARSERAKAALRTTGS